MLLVLADSNRLIGMHCKASLMINVLGLLLIPATCLIDELMTTRMLGLEVELNMGDFVQKVLNMVNILMEL
jgi:hypothetical protein